VAGVAKMRRRAVGDINWIVRFDDPPSAPVGDERSGVNIEEGRRALRRAIVEIDEEVARQRASGAVPGDFESELDRMFGELAPREGIRDHALRRGVSFVERSAAIDLQVPVASRRAGGSVVKRVVRAAVGWYVRFFVSQFSRFALAVARAFNLVAEDLDRLHEEVSALRPSMPSDIVAHQAPGERWWSSLALSALSGVSAPVLHSECGEGMLIRALRAAGVDAYGLDPYGTSSGLAASSGPHIRCEELTDHLRSLPTGALGGAVLEGSVQVLGARGCTQLMSLLSARIADTGVLLVVSLTPEAWGRVADPLVADLAPGHPLHAETWSYLLTRNGFGRIEVHRGGTDLRTRLQESSGGAPTADENLLGVLGALLAGPDEYLVIGVREADAR